MKKYLMLLMVISSFLYGQHDDFNLTINCYKGGEFIPKEAFKDFKLLEIFDNQSNRTRGKCILLSWELSIFYGEGSRANSITKINGSPLLINTALRPLIEGGTVNFPKKIIIDRIILKSEDGRVFSCGAVTFYVGKTNKLCPKSNIVNKKNVSYKGKLLMGKTEKEPVINQKVILNGGNNASNRIAITDKYGDFTFENVNTENSYKLEIPNDGSKIKDGQIYLAKQDGSKIRSLQKVGANFVYELLSVELTKLSVEEADDTELALSSFTNSKNTELSVLKDILFEVNSTNIPMESKPLIDKIINSMKNNKSLKLSIIGHTDSQGDDLKNKQISMNRANNVMNYFVENGIEKERLSVQGLGETRLLNRCKNGVDCSEEEHKLNRRTEFIFSK